MTTFLSCKCPLFLHNRLCDNGAGGGGLVLPGGREDRDGLVVAGETVDTGLDQNQSELGVLVLSVALEVLADGDSLCGNGQYRLLPKLSSAWRMEQEQTYLLDQHVQILREFWGEACM
jgi:hypothetical protein